MKLSDVFEAGVAIVKKEHPELESNLIKSFGFGMGIEFREASLLIASKTKAPAKKGELLLLKCSNYLTRSTQKRAKQYSSYTTDKKKCIVSVGFSFSLHLYCNIKVCPDLC